MLKFGSDLVPAAQVEQEGQRVDVCRPAQKHGHLRNAGKSRTQHNLRKHKLGRKIITASWEILSYLICLLNVFTGSVVLGLPEALKIIL